MRRLLLSICLLALAAVFPMHSALALGAPKIHAIGTDHAPARMLASKGKVLVVVSAADSIPLREGGVHKTGIFLGEVTEPLEALLNAGYSLEFVSPGGKAPTIDPDSYHQQYWDLLNKKRADQEVAYAKRVYLELLGMGLSSPLVLESLAHDEEKLSGYVAVFVPGGHAPLVDLFRRNAFVSDELNTDMGLVLAHFHRTQKPTGLICHAPVALAAAPEVDGKWIYEGYKVTAISRMTEWFNEDFPLTKVVDGHMKEYPSQILRKRGAVFITETVPYVPHVIEDRELMTGQDPFSAKLMAKRFVEKLNSHLAKKK